MDGGESDSSAAIDKWFKRCLKLAGQPETMKMHELRHSAADNLWRQTGNAVLAQQLLSHGDVATTSAYLHPSLDDLEAALEALE
jgi:site-specific recombinase XerD